MVAHERTCRNCGSEFVVDAPANPTRLPNYCSHGCWVIGDAKTIEHQKMGDELIIWTYQSGGDSYEYRFNEDMELTDRFHISDSGRKTRVSPDLTPKVREYLDEHGFDY